MKPEPEPVDVAAQLADIETQPLEQRAEAFGRLHEQLLARLEDADTDPTGMA
ncbi:hypothetical protein [Cryobacterium ruanii]|uniref:hypothetical protein n=1 Tax=Cryobacterium ruanii TaxID=1259197 RepID=UPI00141BE844|nr:hypothetical protein [Cryobacterium ruanii]